MSIRLSCLLLVPVLALAIASPAAAASPQLDPPCPPGVAGATGVIRLAPTDLRVGASATAAVVSTHDDNTAPEDIVVDLSWGDGSPDWMPSGLPQSKAHVYRSAGTYVASAIVFGCDNENTTYPLGTVHVYADSTPPVVGLTVPSPSTVATWKAVSGRAWDSGSGPRTAVVTLTVQHRGRWYAWQRTHWVALPTRALALARSWGMTAAVSSRGRWSAPLAGAVLTGSMTVRWSGADRAGNVATWRSTTVTVS